MKKKLLIAILSTALILSFSACGNDKQQNVSPTQDNPIEENISHDFNADTNLQETAYNISEYSCEMKSHFRKSGNQMSGKWKSSYTSLLA